jgi:parvulin-like peptidyl-prolyl isomerase
MPMASSHATSAVASTSSANVVVPRPTGKPVVRINGVVLTDRDLLNEEYAIFPYGRTHGGIPAGAEADIRRGAMKMIVFEELVYQEAQRRKFVVSSAKVDKAMAEYRKQFHSPDQYKGVLKSDYNNSEQVLREKIKRSLTIDAYLQQEVTARSAISLAEAKAYYLKNPQKFRVEESYSIQSISIVPPDNATPDQLKEAKKHAEEAYKQAKSTKSYDEFGELAERMSEDNYRVMMGDHKAVEVSNLPPPLLQALKNIKPGQITDLLAFDGIYTVVRVNSHNPPRLQTFDEVKDRLRKQMQAEKIEQLRSSLDKKLYGGARVEQL